MCGEPMIHRTSGICGGGYTIALEPQYPDGDEFIKLIKEQFYSGSERRELEFRSDKIKLLEKFALFLEKEGYMDTDWRGEEPFAIDEFLKEDK